MLVGMISKAIARKVAILPCVSQVVLTNGIQSTLIKKDDRSASLHDNCGVHSTYKVKKNNFLF